MKDGLEAEAERDLCAMRRCGMRLVTDMERSSDNPSLWETIMTPYYGVFMCKYSVRPIGMMKGENAA